MVKKVVTTSPVTSATGKSPAASRGFSLLELMVVIFAIGLLSGLVALTLPGQDSDQELRRAAERTASAFGQLRSQAVFRGRTLGLQWRGTDSVVVQRTDRGWTPLELAAKPVDVDEGYTLQLEVAGAIIVPDPKNVEPQLLFLSDGQVSPFVLYLQGEQGRELSFDQSLRVEDSLQ